MKKILTPAIKEDSVFYSDFTGQCFGQLLPEVVVSFSFQYGSKYDSSDFELHLTDKEAEDMLNIVKARLSRDSKKSLKATMSSAVGEEHKLLKFLFNDPDSQ